MPTLRRRNSDPGTGGRAPLRSSLADAAWAVEDRVVWGVADVFRGLVEVVKWPFERVAWATEHWLIWPIQEETALWSRPVRAAVLAGFIVLAAAGVAAGVVISDPSTGGGAGGQSVAKVSAPPVTPAAEAAPLPPSKAVAAQAEPVLHGSSPGFATEQGGGVTKAEAATEPPAAHLAGAGSGTTTGVDAKSTGAAAAGSEVAGPAAIEVARKFAGAFVLYETGHDNAKVKSVFHTTATPDLAKALLERPPRLPANVKVPEAKVLNIVAGPKHGDTYTLSVSLLRVGVTSELRLDMRKTPAGKSPSTTSGAGQPGSRKTRWLVTDVLG
jgi:hypothetical protein